MEVQPSSLQTGGAYQGIPLGASRCSRSERGGFIAFVVSVLRLGAAQRICFSGATWPNGHCHSIRAQNNLIPICRKRFPEWEKTYQSPEDRMAAALAFVQDEIRYMGIEVGPNSHEPNDPSLVFERRFGDCKDKAYLFCTILQAMNINACEALVHTENMGVIADWLPSPYDFDHVVAHVRLNGKTYWLDPTEVHQGGSIDNRFFLTMAVACWFVPAQKA